VQNTSDLLLVTSLSMAEVEPYMAE
jgi:hypothetical protein